MPTLCGVEISPFVSGVRVFPAEKGIAYGWESVAPFGRSEEFMRIVPLGKIPV